MNQYKVYNQDESLTCWIYAAFNTIKNEVAELLNMNINDIDFSVNYISFYDRIEKLNKLYDEVINNNYHISEVKYLFFKYINTCGDFKSFKYLVNKYGLVFDNQMPMTANNYEPGNIDNLLKQKVIIDIEEIMNKKINKLSLSKLKEKYMKENYHILSHIYGKPPKFTSISNIKLSVDKFYNKYIKNIVNNYVSICCLDNLQYEKYYDINFLDMKIDDEKYLNLDLTHIKTSIIKSLKNNHPVWFGCSFRYMSGSYKNTDGILDDRLYLFDKIGIKKNIKIFG